MSYSIRKARLDDVCSTLIANGYAVKKCDADRGVNAGPSFAFQPESGQGMWVEAHLIAYPNTAVRVAVSIVQEGTTRLSIVTDRKHRPAVISLLGA